jgi:hypothetical protein
MRFQFVIALVVSEHILQSTVHLSTFLQGVECDLLEAVKECKTVVEMLRSERDDDTVWNELYQTALDIAEPFEIVESVPRRCRRQTTKANHPADTHKHYWCISLYYPFLDHMIMELDSRLLKSENRFYAQYLLPRLVEQITNVQIVTIHQTYQMDIGLSLDDFRREVECWRARCRIIPCDKVSTTLCQAHDIVNSALYPSIDTIMRVLLTMPVASATVERSLGVLKRSKTYIRSTMRNDRLSALGLMHIHRDCAVNLDKVMDVSVAAKKRRADF